MSKKPRIPCAVPITVSVLVAPLVMLIVTVVAVTPVMGQVPLTLVGDEVKPDRVIAWPMDHGGGVEENVRVKTVPVILKPLGVSVDVLLTVPIRPWAAPPAVR
jgi:hypothetical protein